MKCLFKVKKKKKFKLCELCWEFQLKLFLGASFEGLLHYNYKEKVIFPYFAY
jgi:hypothetical protein